jgi:lipoprotein-anchoring transpeptidase ErfK/SrfK
MLRFVCWIVLVASIGALSSVTSSAPALAQVFSEIFRERDVTPNVSRPHSTHGGRAYRADPGTIEIRTSARTLYFVDANGQAIRYSVGVGRTGQQWLGSTTIVSKHIRPAWTPPAVIRGGKPPWVIPSGSPENPMGAAALVLADHELAIHGTNDPQSIGHYVSWGCIRMHNRDIMDLYDRVGVGTRVVIKR